MPTPMLPVTHNAGAIANMPRLALMIDAENMPASLFPGLLERVEKLGEPIVRCMFGDFSNNRHADWIEVGFRCGLEPVLQLSGGKGKNSVDIALTIRVMDLLHEGRIDGFCLASSDRDFVPLAMRLRQWGKAVYGFGEARTNDVLRRVCSEFFLLEPAVAPPPKTSSPPKPSPAPEPKLHPEIIDLIREITDASPGGFVSLTTLAAEIRTRKPALSSTLCGKGQFLKNLRKTGQIEENGAAGSLRVRLRKSLRQDRAGEKAQPIAAVVSEASVPVRVIFPFQSSGTGSMVEMPSTSGMAT